MSKFVHLNCHSNFSFLFGGSPPEELTEACADAGMDALALTDRDGLYGAVQFLDSARSAGVKPIIGCDLPVSASFPGGGCGGRLVLLARNDAGYRNLCGAVTEYHLGGVPLPVGRLSRYSDGLFAICPEARLLEPLRDVFGESLYAELANTGTAASRRQAERQIEAARKLGVPCVASNRVAFARRDGYDLHRTLCAIRLNRPITRVPAGESADAGCYLKPGAEMERLFSAAPYLNAREAVASTRDIADACEFDFRPGGRLFPVPDLPPGETPFSHLTKLCFSGAARLYQPLTTNALERLHHELGTIERLGFTPYFLVVNDIAGFCRQQEIPAAGRGSAAGSMVAYVLGITCIDPLEHDLYFERFLSPARESPPDIDFDVSWCRRDEVLSYIYRRFGSDRVAMICTYVTMKARMSVRDVARAMGLPREEVDAFAGRLPHCRAGHIEAAAGAIPSCHDLPLDREPYRSILDVCDRLDGFPRHLGVHVGGVVIADRPLTELVPLERSAKGLVITQYDMGPIERLGLVKMDILGQKGLSVIEDTTAWAGEVHGEPLEPDQFPRQDPDTFRLLAEGRTLGVFQIESPGMRSLLQAMNPDCVKDLTLSIALIRPGASGSGMKELFLLRRAGREPVTYLHPDLEPILAESLGTFVYQEQVMRAAVSLAGFTPEEADSLRRAMTSERSGERMEALRSRFLDGATGRGMSEAVALALFESLAKFSGYGFPKAHAATYGEFAYQAAYLKAHFPAQFMAAVLANEAGFYHHSVYVEEAKRLGVRVALPDINHSLRDFHVVDGVLYFGLGRVKGVSRRTVDGILDARSGFPFISLSDFLGRVDAAREEIASLIKCGAFDSLENTRPELLWKLAMMYPEARAARKGPSEPLPLAPAKVNPPRALPRLPDYSPAQRMKMELAYLEASVSAHPLEILVPGELERSGVNSAGLVERLGETISIVGWVIAQRHAVTRKQEYMQFLTLEDPRGTFEVTVFPREYQRLGAVPGASRILRVTGRVSNRGGSTSLIATNLEPLGV